MNNVYLDEISQLSIENEALKKRIRTLEACFNDLISESEGVYGLHLNGDLAPWEELLEGGHYEGWLGVLSEGDK